MTCEDNSKQKSFNTSVADWLIISENSYLIIILWNIAISISNVFFL